MSDQPTVFIVDDNPAIRKSLRWPIPHKTSSSVTIPADRAVWCSTCECRA